MAIEQGGEQTGNSLNLTSGEAFNGDAVTALTTQGEFAALD